MKPFRMLSRGVRDAFKSVFRNFSLSAASIISITITLLVMAIALVISANINQFTENIVNDVTIVSYIDTSTTEAELNALKTEILRLDNIEKITVVTKDEAAEKASQESEVMANIFAQYEEGDNPLYDSFEIKVKDIEKIGETAKKIGEFERVEIVKYGEGLIEQLLSAFDIVKKIAYGVLAALLLVTMFLITNTIKLTIYARKKEIGIMRLVGASNSSIKIPFMIEGILLGLLGSVLPIVFIYFSYKYLFENFNGKLISPLITLVKPTPFIWYVSLILLGIGLVVGMVGSVNSVERHLKL